MKWLGGGRTKDAERVQLETLVLQVREIEGRVKGLETEWATVYQKVHRALGHITKTAALQRRADQSFNGLPVDGQEEAAAPPPPPPPRPRTPDEMTRDEIAALRI